jgi:PPOX class probable F420-dependent enzyme
VTSLRDEGIDMETRTTTLTDSQRAFLEQPFYGAATTLRPDGSPHTTVVWVDVDDRWVSFNTAAGRVKPENLERDPRVSLIVIDPENPYRWLSIDGRAELTTDGADEQIDRLAKKYTGKDEYQRRPGEQRISVRIHPDHVHPYGLD